MFEYEGLVSNFFLSSSSTINMMLYVTLMYVLYDFNRIKGNGLHPTNVRYEPAVYAVTPRQVVQDSTCIAMTRALGDFYAHQFGLTFEPDLRVQLVCKCLFHSASIIFYFI